MAHSLFKFGDKFFQGKTQSSFKARSTSLWGMTAMAVVRRFPGIGMFQGLRCTFPMRESPTCDR
jgi:hypothetical protein